MTDSSNPTAPHGAEPGPTPLRLALVGCGAISRMHRAGLAPLASRCQITAAVDPVLERAQEVGQENGARAFSDLDEALRFAAQEDGFDAVDLMLPHHLHEEMTTRCLRQGLHVLLEKPIAPTVEASRRILAEAEASEGRLMVAENAQYWPEVLRARDWIEAGRIGRVVTAQATVWIPPLRAYYGGDRPWRFQQNAAGGGITLDTGSHWLRALRVWLGDAEAVVGSLGHPVAEMEGESLAHALFRKVVARWFEDWDETFEQAIVRRGSWIVAAGLIALLLPNLGLPVMLARFLLLVLKGFTSICGVLIATASVDLAADAMQRRADRTDTKMDDQLVPLLRRSAKMLTWVIGGLFVLQNMQVDVSSLLGSLAIGGLAFSLAAKDTVANVFGSFTIFTDRPFQIGDWVLIDGTEGTVEEVGFRSTRLRTFYNSVITLPNSAVANATVDNMGQRQYRRFRAVLGLTYDATPEQIEAFVAGIRTSIEEHPQTRKDYFEVHFNAMGAHSLDILVYCFFAVEDWTSELRGKQELMLSWMRLAKEIGVEFAFPTQTLHLEGLAAPPA